MLSDYQCIYFAPIHPQAGRDWSVQRPPLERLSLLPLLRFFLASRFAMTGSRRSSTEAPISYQEVDSDVDIDKEERLAARTGEFAATSEDRENSSGSETQHGKLRKSPDSLTLLSSRQQRAEIQGEERRVSSGSGAAGECCRAPEHRRSS
jgi:hypothetical protein